MTNKDTSGKDSPKKNDQKKPDDKSKKKPQANEDDLYDQGDIATPRRDPPYEDGI